MIFDTPQLLWIKFCRHGAGQNDRLVAVQASAPVHRPGIEPAEGQILFGPDDKEGQGFCQLVEPKEVEITTVYDVERADFQNQVVQNVDVVQLAVGNVDEGRDAAAKIEQGMQLDRPLGLSELCPGKDGQAQVDGGGVQSIDRLVEFHPEVFVQIEFAGNRYQCMGQVGVDAPVANFVGVGQSVPRHLRADIHVEELVALSPQTGFDVAQTFPKGQLGKNHAEKLVVTGEVLDLVIPPVALDASAESVQGQMFEDLRKDQLASIHRASPERGLWDPRQDERRFEQFSSR